MGISHKTKTKRKRSRSNDDKFYFSSHGNRNGNVNKYKYKYKHKQQKQNNKRNKHESGNGNGDEINETDVFEIKYPTIVSIILSTAKCEYLWYHKSSNSFILKVIKYGNWQNILQLFDDQHNESITSSLSSLSMLIKLKLSFKLNKIIRMSIGIVCNKYLNYNIAAYDYNKSCLILDTKQIKPIDFIKDNDKKCFYYTKYCHKYEIVRINDYIKQWKRVF